MPSKGLATTLALHIFAYCKQDWQCMNTALHKLLSVRKKQRQREEQVTSSVTQLAARMKHWNVQLFVLNHHLIKSMQLYIST